MPAHRKPTKLKLLEGNPGRRPLPENEPEPPAVESLEPPSHLSKTAKKHWRERAPMLREVGILTEADQDAFALVCEVWSECRSLERQIKREGRFYKSKKSNYKQASPVVTELNKRRDQLKGLWAEFGMTPASRSRVDARLPEKSESLIARKLGN